MQPEEGQRLHVGGREVGAEDAAVGQRVAVDLARRQRRDPAAPDDGVRVLQVGHALVHVEGAREGDAGVDGPVLQPREPGEQEVDLELRTLGGGSSPETGAESEAASSSSSTRRGQAGVDVAAGALLTGRPAARRPRRPRRPRARPRR